MGIGLVLIIYFVIIFILSVIIAAIASIITYFWGGKENRKRKLLFAFISPFVGLYSFCFFALFGSVVVSETKNIDVGIGDAWYVPLPNNCQLLFIDLPEQAFIEKNGVTVISEVSQLQQIGDKILGKTYENEYFTYNTKTNELKECSTENELTIQNLNIKPELIDAIDFYADKRDELAGFWLLLVGLVSLALSISILYLMKRLIIRKPKIEY